MFLGYINIPNLMTFTGLSAALLACLLSLQGRLGLSLACLMFAGIFDLFDGLVARNIQPKSEDETKFGIQIDTIADMACFGVVPVIIAMNSGLAGPSDFVIQSFYVCCAAMRLGYFNVHGMTGEGKSKYFTGLPVTYAALIFPLIFISLQVLDAPVSHNIIRIAFLLTGALFILKIKVLKPHGSCYFIFPLLAIVVSYYWVFMT